jgi:hypothetical protein
MRPRGTPTEPTQHTNRGRRGSCDCDTPFEMVPDDAANAALKASRGGLVMNFIRYAAICGHLVEEFRWLGQPTCFVDGHQVSGSFDRAVADLQVASRASPGNRSRNTSRSFGSYTLTTDPLGAQDRKEDLFPRKTGTTTTRSSATNIRPA